MKRIVVTSFAAFALMCAPAWALDLHEARAQGILGEKVDGYVAVLKASSDANALAGEVNAKRKAEYTRISKQNGQPVDVVAKLAAPQIMQGLESGAMYQDGNGGWKKR